MSEVDSLLDRLATELREKQSASASPEAAHDERTAGAESTSQLPSARQDEEDL
jgi:hypothetical protein